MAKIKRVEAKSFKRLREVVIDCAETVITISGSNANGKSSVLDAIAAALGGERLCPAEPVKRGERTALARVTLDDGLVAERRWEIGKDGKTRTKLEVRSPDGRVLPSPQGVLDKLIGKLSFDPEAFARAEPKKQLELLRAVTGINLAELDTKRSDLFAERTEVNREVKAAESAVLDLADLPPPGEPVAVAELLEEQRAAITAHEQRRSLVRAAADARATAEQLATSIGDLKKRLLQLEADYKRVSAAADSAEAELLMAADPPDVDAIGRRILAAQTTNEEVAARQRKLDERAAKQRLLEEVKAQSEQLSRRIEEVDAEKERQLAAAKFPVPGLGFGAEGVTYKGLPFEQASSAEKIRVSMAMGLALNPELRVVQIRNGSLLDEDSMAIVEQLAEEADAQVLLEVVGKRGGGIVIQDGAVAVTEEAA
ncbi:MAG TPA: AAA family ATPase [Myxococcales bacterium]|nr:AAA family ATPase [Myxococcales bacterium]